MSAQLGGGFPASPPMPTQYISATNHAANVTANQMAAMAQLRSPAGVGRPIVPSVMLAMPTAPHMPVSAMINPATGQRQSAGEPRVPMQQVVTAPSGGMPQCPSMASVVAAGPNVRPVTPQVPRTVLHPGMGALPGAFAKVRFTQTAINVSQPSMAPSNMPSVLAPLGDQSPLTISALSQLSQGDQKRTLGKRLFPLAQEMCPTLAQELTAMLSGVDNAEVIHWNRRP